MGFSTLSIPPTGLPRQEPEKRDESVVGSKVSDSSKVGGDDTSFTRTNTETDIYTHCQGGKWGPPCLVRNGEGRLLGVRKERRRGPKGNGRREKRR